MSDQESPETESETGTDASPDTEQKQLPKEYGGRKGREPTRYGDWEKNGRCIDF